MSTIIDLASRRPLSPPAVIGKVTTPRRPKNLAVRSREHLLKSEVEAIVKAAKAGHYGQRNATLIEMMFRHGLWVSEAIALRWDAVDFKTASLYVTRLKRGSPSKHPLRGPELRMLRDLRRDWPDSKYLFVSERGGPMTASNVRKLIARLGVEAKIGFPVHPHMLRHATGYYLANDQKLDTRIIQDYLGHKSITHTVRYTKLADDRFEDCFTD